MAASNGKTKQNKNSKKKRKKSVVYMTTDISAEGLVKIYEKPGWKPKGKVAVKVSTGEPPASNYLRPELIGDLVKKVDGTIVECNTAYGGDRSSTAMHRQVAREHGFTEIADVDIMDAKGSMAIKVKKGKHLKKNYVGKSFKNYKSYIILSHFKGHAMADFGGAIKNASIGLASSKGKGNIHSGGTSFDWMYGTIPIAGAFKGQGMRDDWLAAFMMASVLLNPQLLMYSVALGFAACMVRLVTCYFCGVMAGYLLHFFYEGKSFFDFIGFEPGASRDIDPNLFMRFLKNLLRNIKATGIDFLFGIFLSALFARYVPADAFADLFGAHRRSGVFLAATIGVPLYACGGGTIPLLQEWLSAGMSLGSAASFMITGPATKITNLGALKIVLGMKRFIFYLAFVMVFSLFTGLIVNLIF